MQISSKVVREFTLVLNDKDVQNLGALLDFPSWDEQPKEVALWLHDFHNNLYTTYYGATGSELPNAPVVYNNETSFNL